MVFALFENDEPNDCEQIKDESGISIEQEVDLGLPSGTIWAGWNVGASTPEQFGGYYAWGETEEKSDYTWETYRYWVDRNGDGDMDSNEITNIGTNISGTQYDVARQKWGGSWRMPTKAEIDELDSKCSWTWYQYKGVWGQKVTGPNGNSIFLPAAGKRTGTSLFDDGSGYYGSATLNEGFDGSSVWRLCFYNRYSGGSVSSCIRNSGLTVRPVK